MLAGTPRGLTEYFLLAHGFSVEMLSSLVLAKLAIVVNEPMMAHRGATSMVERIRITNLAGCRLPRQHPAYSPSLPIAAWRLDVAFIQRRCDAPGAR